MLKFKKIPVAAALGALIGVSGLGRQTTFAQESSQSMLMFRVQKASDLIGKSVVDAKGEDLGQVHDLAIDPDRGRVAYVVLSFGGFLGVGDKWFAIPAGALTLPEDCRHFVLKVERDRLKNAKGFDKDRWPQMGNPEWGNEVFAFYGQKPYWINEDATAAPKEIRIQKATEIIGRSVQNDRGENLGNIKDLVIDPDRAQLTYAVLSFGGFLGMGDKLFAIPAGVLKMPGTASYVVLTVSKDRLQKAPGFDKNNWPNLADPTLASSIYEFYNQPPYWTEDLRGGQYMASAAGKKCERCGHMTVERAFVRDGRMYCCCGCANGTGCTCGSAMGKSKR
ncbi:MAG: hypothetical protein BroJett003_16690 [Planctomycetota bacterium]|nr:MAG: hypothetical protein BroJett003_16690 [Planctomycetota bacterium]